MAQDAPPPGTALVPGVSVGTVKSQVRDVLARLREVAVDTVAP